MISKKVPPFENVVWNRVAELIKERDIKQSWLVQQCKRIGMPISQPELSKIYNGKKKLNVYELAALSKVLEVPMGFFVFGETEQQKDFFDMQNSTKLICDGTSENFEAYFGDYFVYFNSTMEQEENLQYGQLSINQADEGYCKATLIIHTGIYRAQKEIIKKYEGYVVITISLSGAYIIIKNEAIGELCFMVFRHRAFSINQLECRIALCLTMGAGENKLPTSHRMLLCRQQLPEEALDIVRAYLLIHGNDICIEKEKVLKLNNLLEDEKDKRALQNLFNILPEKQYYEVSIDLLRRHLDLNREKFAVFIADLLKLAETEPYIKVYENDDNLLFSLIGNNTLNREKYFAGAPPE